MQIPRYSNLPLAGKFLIPILSIFLGIWAIGTLAVGSITTQAQVNGLKRETENTASHVLHELESIHDFLSFKANSIAEIVNLSAVIENKDQQTLLQMLLPLRSSLDLDLVKVIDQEGTVLSDLRSPAIAQAKLQDSGVLQLAQSGLVFSSLIVSETSSPPLLVEVISIKSRQDVVGSVIVGHALTPEELTEILGNRQQQLILLQESKMLTSTLAIDDLIQWSERTSQAFVKEIQIGSEQHFSQAVKIPQIADDRFQFVVLTPLESLHKSQQQIWLITGSFGLMGGVIVFTIGVWVAHVVSRRMTQLTQATQDLAAGDLTVRLRVDGSDEVATLAAGFNQMAKELNQREQKIQSQVEELEHLVQELQQMPQLVQTEKMAGLGQMVAGVAHEINNPVSFIYGNVEPAKEYVNDLINLIHLYEQHFPNPPAEIQTEAEAVDIDFLNAFCT